MYLACGPGHLGASQTCYGRGLPSTLHRAARDSGPTHGFVRPTAERRRRTGRGDLSTSSPDVRSRSRSFTGSARRLAPRANNGHAPPFRPFRSAGCSTRRARRAGLSTATPEGDASRSRRLDPVRSTALSRIEPQYPRLVVPLRQSLQVSLLRAYSPDGPIAELPSCDPPGTPSLSVIGVSGPLRRQRSPPRLQRCLIAFAPEDLAPHRARAARRPPGRLALLPGSTDFTPPLAVASARATLVARVCRESLRREFEDPRRSFGLARVGCRALPQASRRPSPKLGRRELPAGAATTRAEARARRSLGPRRRRIDTPKGGLHPPA